MSSKNHDYYILLIPEGFTLKIDSTCINNNVEVNQKDGNIISLNHEHSRVIEERIVRYTTHKSPAEQNQNLQHVTSEELTKQRELNDDPWSNITVDEFYNGPRLHDTYNVLDHTRLL